MTEEQRQVKTIKELLGIEPKGFVTPGTLEDEPEFEEESKASFEEEVGLPVQGTEPSFLEKKPDEKPVESDKEPVIEPIDMTGLEKRSVFSRDFVRYPLIFIIAFGLFYVLLNFQAVSTQVISWFSPPPQNEEVVLGQEQESYDRWIKKYFVHITNTELLKANNDADGDGLTNLDEYYLNTNPLKSDTDGDGYDDGQEILSGYNPLYIGTLRPNQEQIIRDHIDLDRIRSRKDFRGTVDVAYAATIPQRDGYETSLGRDFPVDRFAVDRSKPGRVQIPKIGVDAPIIWSTAFEHMEEDLKYGATHHPATPYPGERGTASVHGHSSGYPWDGGYKYVFTKINLLEAGDEVFVTVTGTTGQTRTYRYIVRTGSVYGVEDEAQFADYGGYHLNISTSWPIGTARERYVVTTELAGL